MPLTKEEQLAVRAEREQQAAEVIRLKQEGMSTAKACKKAGITVSLFYYFKPKGKRVVREFREKKTRKPRRIEIPMPAPGHDNPGRIFALVGAPREIMEAIRGML